MSHKNGNQAIDPLISTVTNRENIDFVTSEKFLETSDVINQDQEIVAYEFDNNMDLGN